jgi:hypothetical protein
MEEHKSNKKYQHELYAEPMEHTHSHTRGSVRDWN